MSDLTRQGPSGLPPHLDPRAAPPTHGAADRSTPARPGRVGALRRVLRWACVVLSLAVLVTAGVGYALVSHYNGQIAHVPVLGAIAGHLQPAKAPRNATNYLLVGSDSRAGASGVGTQGTGASFVTGQRSDTVILVHLFGGSDKAQLVSFPRDSYVEIPQYTDPKTHVTTPVHHAKLNSSFALGGPPLLIATVEKLTNIRIDHFLQIDFAGFKGMVNQLGGVDVCLTHAAKESNSGIDLSAGQHHISGEMALSFVRQRYNLPNGDLDRIKRQQQFIGSLVRKVLSAGTLLNPFKLNGFLDVATHSLTADQGLGVSNLKDIALRLRGFNAGGVIFTTIPTADIAGHRDGQDVVLLDVAKDAALFGQLRADHPPSAPAPAPAAGTRLPAAGVVTVPPAKVRVAVLNGSGISGLGHQAVTDLTAAGFDVVGPAGTRGSGATATTVLYGPTRTESAATLAAAIPGSVLTPDPSLGGTLEVLLGSSYHGASTVPTLPSAPPPTPTTGTKGAPTAPITTAANTTCTT